MSVLKLAEMPVGQEADVFAMLSAKEELTAKNGKPYFKVTFRDASREVSFPIWSDSPWSEDCRAAWKAGAFYKLRAVCRDSNFGPQLEIRRIRECVPGDAAEGFDPCMMQARSRFDPQAMWDELMMLVETQIAEPKLKKFVETILQDHKDAFIAAPAARRNHHAMIAGLLEHTLSVAKNCVFLADKYADYYCDMQPPLCKGLVVAGGILHDIGKLRELEARPEETVHTPAGELIGHILLGRDMVRETAVRVPLDPETQLRLEHIIVSHQRLPEWGSPKPPMTPEALLVHYADDLDAKFCMMAGVLRDDRQAGPITSRKNVLGQAVYRGT